jgi:hypothetical protein
MFSFAATTWGIVTGERREMNGVGLLLHWSETRCTLKKMYIVIFSDKVLLLQIAMILMVVFGSRRLLYVGLIT